MRRLLPSLMVGFLFACGTQVQAPDTNDDDLPVGDRLPDDAKTDGTWGAALNCKPIPNLPVLKSPRITISIDGLSLHLVDTATGYDKVFPVGVGAIEGEESASAFQESKTYYPIIATGSRDFSIRSSNIQPCKTWWTDPETGIKTPVFAGLPFMPFYGGYAIHGPIDNYRATNGGNLRRGYVSHGCIRMESADVLEVYARTRGLAVVPVRLQREAERDTLGRRVDAVSRWLGAECQADADCNYTGGLCKQNRFSGRGFCTARCTTTCADRAGQVSTFCVADPDNTTVGICVPKVTAQDHECRNLDHFRPVPTSRFKQPTVPGTVCLPGSRGWVGDHCFTDGQCHGGTRCAGATSAKPGVCTMPCSGLCPDEPATPWTFCATDLGPTIGARASCLRQCTPASNASECPADSDCVSRTRSGGSDSRYVCVPRH